MIPIQTRNQIGSQTGNQTRKQFHNHLLHFAALLFLLCAAVLLPAQNTTAGALTGTITDSTGALVPGAKVTVTNQGTHQAASATSTEKGSYDVENLPDGDYTISVALPGFQQASVANVHLDPGQRRGQDVKLTLGNVDTKVTVQADTIAVQTESAESGGTISAKEVANLMLNGRNFQQLATLVPGVSSTNGSNQEVNSGYLGQTFLIVGGQSSEETTYTIDGVYNMTPTSLINITPSIDAINEMRVLKNAYSAKYGYAGSGQILIETKSGTRDFHGSGYEYIRNNSFAVAKPYSVSGLPVTQSSLHYNIFGFSFGGPVYIPHVYNTGKNKTFFFTGAEFKINHYAVGLASRSELTAAQRAGDLSHTQDGVACTLTGSNAANAAAAGCTGATLSDYFLKCDSHRLHRPEGRAPAHRQLLCPRQPLRASFQQRRQPPPRRLHWRLLLLAGRRRAAQLLQDRRRHRLRRPQLRQRPPRPPVRRPLHLEHPPPQLQRLLPGQLLLHRNPIPTPPPATSSSASSPATPSPTSSAQASSTSTGMSSTPRTTGSAPHPQLRPALQLLLAHHH
jgi:hypothetical protein